MRIANSIVVGVWHENGRGKYRGIDMMTGKKIFEKEFTGGTNHVFEFLAVVHALALPLTKEGKRPVYTTSTTAKAWVRDKGVKTSAYDRRSDGKDKVLYNALFRAVDWLYKNPDHGQVLMWEKSHWGESPAKYQVKKHYGQ